MDFVFERGADGYQRVLHNGIALAYVDRFSYEDATYTPIIEVAGVGSEEIMEAIELAHEQGFWVRRPDGFLSSLIVTI